jgi:hypothetical protein
LHAKVQLPDTHAGWPFATLLGHMTPHALQLFGSLIGLTHAPAQRISPAGQPLTHVPPMQSGVPPGHACPQLPQLFGSPVSSMHAPWQLEYPVSQANPQFPPAQLAVA